MSKKVKLGIGKWALRKPLDRLIAVIDIGSNSVRMVVFKGLRRNPKILFNERILCGLGRHVSVSGKMDEEAMISALSTLKRFAILCNDMKVDVVSAFATSAVRDASNGKEFLSLVHSNSGFNVRILSGEDEATYSALGVISGFPKTSGIVGDLGGGSLELIHIENDKILDRITLPLGPIRLLGDAKKLNTKQLKFIEQELNQVSWLKEGKDKPFYMVGGAWRTLTRLYLSTQDYGLKVLHGLEIEAPMMLNFCDIMAKKSPAEIDRVSKISKRRMPLVPTAASILEAVLSKTNSSNVVSSDNGVREGILYKMLNHKLRAQDPFIAACKDIADATGRFPEHASKLMKWMDPIFVGETQEETRLRYAVCMLSDSGWEGHPDFRAEKAFEEVFHGRFTGIGHRGRAIVALALYINYGGPYKSDVAKSAKVILNNEDKKKAQIIGLTLRLGQRLTGGTSHPLTYTQLKIDKKNVSLILPVRYFDLGGEVVMGRLASLAKNLGLEAEIIRS